MNLLDDIAFTVPGLMEKESDAKCRVWYTPDGDGVGLYHFAVAPDIPGSLEQLADVRLALSRFTAASGAAIVEIDVVAVDGCKALKQCVKVAQPGRGFTFIGSITLPFRDFSFVLKIQCEERKITGMREALVLDEKLKSGEVRLSPNGEGIEGWMKDPYDAARTSGLARNLADDKSYDARFPDHPLSRARRFLVAAEESVRVADTIKAAPPFNYRAPAPPSKPWWKLW